MMLPYRLQELILQILVYYSILFSGYRILFPSDIVRGHYSMVSYLIHQHHTRVGD